MNLPPPHLEPLPVWLDDPSASVSMGAVRRSLAAPCLTTQPRAADRPRASREEPDTLPSLPPRTVR